MASIQPQDTNEASEASLTVSDTRPRWPQAHKVISNYGERARKPGPWDPYLAERTEFLLSLTDIIVNYKARLGAGGFGVVYQGLLRDPAKRDPIRDHIAVAVKQMALPEGTVDEDEFYVRRAKRLAREVIIWTKLHHPNILPFYGYYLAPDLRVAWLVSPLLSNGNLMDHVHRTNANPKTRLRLMVDTARGVEHMHREGIVHGDLKPSNVLVGSDGRAVLSDMGLASIAERKMPKTNLTTVSGQCGTFRFWSPELASSELVVPTKQSDVWAWGCVLLECITDEYPWPAVPMGADETVICGYLYLRWKPFDISTLHIAADLQALLADCWSDEATLRPDMKTCLERLVKVQESL